MDLTDLTRRALEAWQIEDLAARRVELCPLFRHLRRGAAPPPSTTTWASPTRPWTSYTSHSRPQQRASGRIGNEGHTRRGNSPARLAGGASDHCVFLAKCGNLCYELP